MQAADILFEKIIQDHSIENDLLIKASEHRRSFLRNMQRPKKGLEAGELYYKGYNEMIRAIDANKSHLSRQPLFLWNEICSNSFLYEKLNIEHSLCDMYVKEANLTINLRDKRRYYMSAIEMATNMLNTLSQYHWEDSSLIKLPIMQDRYHLSKLFKLSGLYYNCMNEFSVEENNKANKLCIERAFQFTDAAYHLWEHDSDHEKKVHQLKCLHVLECAKALGDDSCGEKVAMLRDFIGNDNTPEIVNAEYITWKQQNDQVYFQKEESSFQITFYSLEDLFRILPKRSE